MPTISLIRRFIPTRIRIKAYVMIISIAGRYKALLYPLLYMLHGCIPKGISVVNKKPMYHYRGISIDSPKDSIEAYVEVFHDNVYDRVSVPRVGNVVVDIGAYVGMYSIKASQYVGSAGLIVAVEPLSSNISYLKRNLMPCPNTRIVEVALSNYEGCGNLHSSSGSAVHSMVYVTKTFERVKVTTLDKLVKELKLPRVDYIKMDAEGSELLILEGARATLVNYFPVLSMACYHTDSKGIPNVSKVIAYLENIGYKCFNAKGYVYAQKGD